MKATFQLRALQRVVLSFVMLATLLSFSHNWPFIAELGAVGGIVAFVSLLLPNNK
jgi:hypothetical protein